MVGDAQQQPAGVADRGRGILAVLAGERLGCPVEVILGGSGLVGEGRAAIARRAGRNLPHQVSFAGIVPPESHGDDPSKAAAAWLFVVPVFP